MIATVERFLEYLRHERNLSWRTVDLYRRDLDQWVSYATAGGHPLDLATVTASDLRAWLIERSSHGDCPGTLRHKVQALRALYRYLLRRGEVAANPAAQVELAKMPKPLPKFVREKTVDAVLDAGIDMQDFTQVRDRLMVMLLYETGIRLSELIGLQDSAVDVTKHELKVRGKRDKDRIVPFGDELAQWVETYRALRAAVGAECGNLLITLKGKPLYPSLVYHVVHDALAQAGGSGKLSPHVLRHTFASVMLNNGAQLNSVKELLGHENLAATQVYTHVTLSELQHNYELAHPRALKKGGYYGY
ncbi:MAG: tyrosine-type recombinase/integrase [Muribaculaceae bacterium]|nr:tyrosine-type recombinase/integrase [Muribaculaceae bacterium]